MVNAFGGPVAVPDTSELLHGRTQSTTTPCSRRLSNERGTSAPQTILLADRFRFTTYVCIVLEGTRWYSIHGRFHVSDLRHCGTSTGTTGTTGRYEGKPRSKVLYSTATYVRTGTGENLGKGCNACHLQQTRVSVFDRL